MTLIKSISSWLLRKASRYTLAMLDFFAYNKYYKALSLIVAIISIFNTGPIWNVVWNFIIATWAFGWNHEITDLEEENKQLKDKLQEIVDSDDAWVDAEALREELASLSHDIWANDVLSLQGATPDELDRANTPYNDLSDNDKEHNRKKADLILDVVSLPNVEVDD